MYGNEWVPAGSWQEGNVLKLVMQYTLLCTFHKPLIFPCLASL